MVAKMRPDVLALTTTKTYVLKQSIAKYGHNSQCFVCINSTFIDSLYFAMGDLNTIEAPDCGVCVCALAKDHW